MASDTVRDAVRLMAAPGDGIAPAAVADLVRRRLADDPVGRAALTALDDAPDDPGTVRRLEGTIRALGDRDPAFLAALTRVVHRATAAPADPPALPEDEPPAGTDDAPPPVPPRTPLTIGPVSFARTPAGRAALAVTACGLAALVGLGAYGGWRVTGGSDTSDPGEIAITTPPPGGGDDARAAVVLTEETVADALPNSFDLPDGWLLAALPVTTIATLNHDSGTLSGPQATVSYTDDAGMTADVTLYALDNTEIAQVLLEELALSSSDGSARPLDLPAIGDGSFAYETGISRPQPRFVVVRTGATIALVSGRGEEGQPFDIGHLEQLARLVSDRVRTARTP